MNCIILLWHIKHEQPCMPFYMYSKGFKDQYNISNAASATILGTSLFPWDLDKGNFDAYRHDSLYQIVICCYTHFHPRWLNVHVLRLPPVVVICVILSNVTTSTHFTGNTYYLCFPLFSVFWLLYLKVHWSQCTSPQICGIVRSISGVSPCWQPLTLLPTNTAISNASWVSGAVSVGCFVSCDSNPHIIWPNVISYVSILALSWIYPCQFPSSW